MCKVRGFYQKHSLRSSYTVYQAALGWLTHTLRLRSRKSSNNSNASVNPHTKFLFFCPPVDTKSHAATCKTWAMRGWGKVRITKGFLYVLFLYYLEWRLKCEGAKSTGRLKKKSICFVPEHGATCTTRKWRLQEVVNIEFCSAGAASACFWPPVF